jgi:hypothetical protein
MQLITRKKEQQIDALVEQLRRANEAMSALMLQMQQVADSLEARVSALEAFQKTLLEPGDNNSSN